MKKAICLVLTTVLLLAFAACGDEKTLSSSDTGKTSENTALQDATKDFNYSINPDDTITITKYLGSRPIVDIPEKINGKTVTKIGQMAFLTKGNIISVTLPDTVTHIELAAFSNCIYLKNIELSKSLVSIDMEAFDSCSSLQSLNCPPTLKTIGIAAFKDCTALTDIKLNEGLTEIGNNSFNGCTGIKSIVFPDSLIKIDHKAFSECTSLDNIKIRKGIDYGEGVFDNCSSLTNVTIEEGVQKISSGCLVGTAIKEIVLPDSVTVIEGYAFSGCSQLETVKLNEGLTEIGKYVFARCPKLTEIIIPSTITKVEEYSFAQTNLKSVKFEGDAPQKYTDPDWPVEVEYKNYTVYYHKGAKGFTSPKWYGYETEIW